MGSQTSNCPTSTRSALPGKTRYGEWTPARPQGSSVRTTRTCLERAWAGSVTRDVRDQPGDFRRAPAGRVVPAGRCRVQAVGTERDVVEVAAVARCVAPEPIDHRRGEAEVVPGRSLNARPHAEPQRRRQRGAATGAPPATAVDAVAVGQDVARLRSDVRHASARRAGSATAGQHAWLV